MHSLLKSENTAPNKNGPLGGLPETLSSTSATADAQPPLVRSLRYANVARFNWTRQGQSRSPHLWVPAMPELNNRGRRHQPRSARL